MALSLSEWFDYALQEDKLLKVSTIEAMRPGECLSLVTNLGQDLDEASPETHETCVLPVQVFVKGESCNQLGEYIYWHEPGNNAMPFFDYGDGIAHHCEEDDWDRPTFTMTAKDLQEMPPIAIRRSSNNSSSSIRVEASDASLGDDDDDDEI